MSERYLRERGKAIWASFGASSLPAGQQALVHEACRLADGLDNLDAILGSRQKEWAKIETDDGGEVTLVVDGLLSERRQHVIAFSQVMERIRAAGLKEGTPKTTGKGEGREARVFDLITGGSETA